MLVNLVADVKSSKGLYLINSPITDTHLYWIKRQGKWVVFTEEQTINAAVWIQEKIPAPTLYEMLVYIPDEVGDYELEMKVKYGIISVNYVNKVRTKRIFKEDHYCAEACDSATLLAKVYCKLEEYKVRHDL